MHLCKIVLLLIIFSFSGCNFTESYFSSKRKSLEFVNTFLSEDFAKCTELMSLELYPGMTKDSMQSLLRSRKRELDLTFGKNIKSTFISNIMDTDSNRIFYPSITHQLGLVQIANDHFYGHLEIGFDNTNGKVDTMELIFKKLMPDHTLFYLFVFFAVITFLVKIFAIWKVMKSELSKKWVLVIAILVLNFPAIIYTFKDGLYLDTITFISSLPYNFWRNFDIDNRGIGVALPLGALLVLYKLYYKKDSDIQEVSAS